MAVTLADVAARAGVSAATVSRVLNGNYPVAGPTRSRVLRAVEELEYVVNGPASSLAASTSDLIGVLVNDIADPFFGVLAGAVQSAIVPPATSVAGRGQKLAVVCNTGGSPERELTYLTLLQRQRAAAVVLTGGTAEDPEHQAALAARLRRLADGGARVVFCGRPQLPAPARPHPATAFTAVDKAAEPTQPIALTFDNEGGARELTEHLLALGHHRLGYLAGPERRTTTRARLTGHRAALASAGLAPDASQAAGSGGGGGGGLILHGAYDRATGYHGTLELLRRDPAMSAVVAANDTVALGVCAALRDQGLRVPEDVSVAGFDDLPFAADAAPALTTVRLDLHAAGTRAGRLALGLDSAAPGVEETLPAQLITRASTAPPRPGGGAGAGARTAVVSPGRRP